MPLFHCTDTVRLPWIVRAGGLRPGRNKVGNYPAPEFIWANTNPRDDGMASIDRGEPYRSGMVRHVRLTLPQDQFIPWRNVPSLYPSWTEGLVERLQRTAAGRRTRPEDWWCRVEPLPLAQISLSGWHWRSYRSNQWSRMPEQYSLHADHWPFLALRVGDHCFASQQVEGPRGQQEYRLSAALIN